MEEKRIPLWKAIMLLPYLVVCLFFIASINHQDRVSLRRYRKLQKQKVRADQ